jgi:hypothetical protein
MADFESSRAVIVGINGYGNGVSVLRSAVNGAQVLAKILGADHGYSLTLLTDREATLDDLERHFGQILPQQVGDKDRVLVYFAGHGIAEDGEDGPTGYLLPQDARPDDRASFLRMETFRGWLGKLRCRHLLVILDCCLAGAFRWTKETRHIRPILKVIHRERYERFIRHPAWQAIASAAYDQEALDAIAGKVLGRRRPAADNIPNSPFASALFEGLKGAADLTGTG